MKELTQIRQAVIDALCEAGLHALAAFPDCRAPRDTPSTTVAVGAAEGTALGFCNYLGQQYDPEQGTVTECYGKLLDGEISVEIRAPGASGCEQICEPRPPRCCWEACPPEFAPESCDGRPSAGKKRRECFCAGAACGAGRSLPPWPGRTAKPSWTLP